MWCFCVPCTSFRVDPQWPDLTCYRSKLENRIPKVDLPEIKGNHRKFRNLVTSYIGNSVYVCVRLSILYTNVCMLVFHIILCLSVRASFCECVSCSFSCIFCIQRIKISIKSMIFWKSLKLKRSCFIMNFFFLNTFSLELFINGR